MSILKPTLIASSLLLSLGAHAADAPKYVFFMIGDGMGTAQRQISEYYLQQQNGDETQRLAINAMPVAGIITTHSANTLVTDSAAAGTALATGVKTDNGVIAIDPEGHKLRSTLDAAKDKGMATGIVTTTRLTHATPATFVAKNISRDNENEIANDYLASNVDFFAGGGYRHFINGEGSKRKDGKNLVDGFKQKGYHTFIGADSSADFLAFHPTNSQKVFASFASSHLPYEIDRKKDLNTPSLAQMTSKAIETLKYDPDGFFMLVEGGRIDHAAHANDVSTVIQDTIAFDQAVKAAVDFYEHHKDETLIIVAGDHETGGMGLGLGENYFVQLDKLKVVDESIEDKLQGVYKGDRKAFMKHIDEHFGLKLLTKEEQQTLNHAMDIDDELRAKNITDFDGYSTHNDATYGGYDPVAIAVAHITSQRAGVYWTSYAHTATQLPLSAVGVGAEKFGNFEDNTQVAKTLATLMNVKIGS